MEFDSRPPDIFCHYFCTFLLWSSSSSSSSFSSSSFPSFSSSLSFSFLPLSLLVHSHFLSFSLSIPSPLCFYNFIVFSLIRFSLFNSSPNSHFSSLFFHFGPERPKIQNEVLGHSLVRLLVCSHHSLVRLLRPTHFARALCSRALPRSLVRSLAHFAHSLAPLLTSLTPSLVGQ